MAEEDPTIVPHSHADLFLNIADSNAVSQTKSELRSPLPSRGYSFDVKQHVKSLQEINNASQTSRHLLAYRRDPNHRHSASAHPLDEARRNRLSGLGVARTIVSAESTGSFRSQSAAGRRRSINTTALGNRPSNQSLESGRPPNECSNSFEDNSEGSAISTAAPSAVWDELDDLKSRLRRLELNGQLAPTSNAAMLNSGSLNTSRPQTSSTGLTTISMSPQNRTINQQQPDKSITAPASSKDHQSPSTAILHPLLHDALATAKASLPVPIFRALESAAHDALALAAIARDLGPADISIPSQHNPRALRRKADSLCRSLTDTCIALCEGSQTTAVPSPTQSSLSIAPQHATPSDGNQDDYADQDLRASSRLLSRLQARRASLGVDPLTRTPSSTPHLSTTSPVPVRAWTTSARPVSQSGTDLGGRRAAGSLSHETISPFNTKYTRSESRAGTDLTGRHDMAESSRGSLPFPSQTHSRPASRVGTEISARRVARHSNSLEQESLPMSTPRLHRDRPRVSHDSVTTPSTTARLSRRSISRADSFSNEQAHASVERRRSLQIRSSPLRPTTTVYTRSDSRASISAASAATPSPDAGSAQRIELRRRGATTALPDGESTYRRGTIVSERKRRSLSSALSHVQTTDAGAEEKISGRDSTNTAMLNDADRSRLAEARQRRMNAMKGVTTAG